MRKVLIVNLTRLGDLLQTSPTIAGLHEEADTEVTVLVERNFAEVCHGLPGVDHVRALDLDRLGAFILEGTGAGLRAAYQTIAGEVAALRSERFDLALNYSSSRMSAVLLGLLRVSETRGWTMTPDGHRLIAGPWSRLFSASALTRRQAPFNLVDYYKRAAGVRAGPQRLLYAVSSEGRARVDGLLAAHGHAGEPLVALQVGASRDVRRWPVASFVALGRAVAERIGARVLLCGGNGDREEAAEIARALGPVAIDLTGRTSIAELAGVLERAAVLVTSDTGPMHLAVAVGTSVVALFFGPALPVDTGPYAADHVCLHAAVPCAPCDHNVTCLNPFCREELLPLAVADAVVGRSRGDWAALAAAADRWPGIAWYRTAFDAEGLFDVVPLGSRPADRRERVRRAYRALWKAVLEGTPPAPAAGPALEREARAIRDVAALAAEAHGTAARVESLARAARSAEVGDALEAEAERLETLDAALLRRGAVHEPAALLLQVFRFEKESLADDDVVPLAAATRRLHADLEAHARTLADLLDPPAGPSAASQGGSNARVD